MPPVGGFNLLPKVNQTMFIQSLHTSREADSEHAVTYRSRVADVTSDSFLIEIPMDEKSGRYHRSQMGETYRITYFTPEGVKHQFATEVVGFRKDAVALVEIRKPAQEDVTREQRRHFLRVEAQLELAVRIGEKLRFVSLTDDVGGGGVSFRCERKWPIVPQTELSCWLLIPYRSGSVTHAQFEGEVIRVREVEPRHLAVMMRFKDISEAEQQKVIRFCFERQLDFRKD
jgi:c-di-GMP-binding flagellar brake protein YcgR